MADTIAGIKLLIDSSEQNLTTKRLRLSRLVTSYDRGQRLEFRETGKAHFHPSYTPGQDVELQIDIGSGYNTRFLGRIESRDLIGEGGQEEINYVCAGLTQIVDKEVTSRHPTRNVELVVFNMPIEDLNYDSNLAGLQVGQMLAFLFDEHADDLRALGAAPASGDPYVQSELDALSVVPADTVTMLNFGFTSAIEDLLQFEDRILYWIDPDTLLWHFDHVNNLTPTTITLVDEADLIVTSQIQESVEDAFTAWTIHGREQQEIKLFSLVDGTLEENWDTGLESGWTIEDSWVIQDEFEGQPSSHTTTSVDVSPSPGWTSNEWDGGIIVLRDESASGSPPEVAVREVSGNDADTINWAWPVSLGDITDFRLYKQGHPDSWYVFRRYRPTNVDDRAIIERLDPPMPSVLGGGIGGSVFSFISRPVMFVEYDTPISIRGFPVPITVDTSTGDFIAPYPLVQIGTPPGDLHYGGAFAEPSDVKVLAGVVTTPLTARYPASGYEGTAFSAFGVQRERIEHLPRWRNPADQAIFDELAEKKLGPFKNVARRGRIKLAGYVDGFALLGVLLNIDTAAAYDGLGTTTGLESANMLVAEVEYAFTDKQGDFQVTTTLTIDDNRRPWRGEENIFPWMERIIESFYFRTSPTDITIERIESVFGFGENRRQVSRGARITHTRLS